jgi:DNA-directed RNA polymerase specialized sigma24 family protein
LQTLLTTCAEPVLRNIANYKLRAPLGDAVRDNQAVNDVCGEVLVNLMARLRELKANPDEKPIGSFRSYVAVAAYNACHEHLRQMYPRRYSLRNKIRYLLSHQSTFALWELAGEYLCGFSEWENKRDSAEGSRRLRELRDDARAFARSKLSYLNMERLHLGELVSEIFAAVESSIELDDLVNAVAEWKGIKDEKPESNLRW